MGALTMPKLLDGTPIEPTEEELDIAEMSANKVKKIDTTLAVKIDDVATTNFVNIDNLNRIWEM
jgi:hypothetical protein